MIYFDNAATTAPFPAVLETTARVQKDFFANPSSPSLPGKKARQKIEECRAELSALLGLKAGNSKNRLLFTASATEANNTIIKGIGGGARRTRKVAFLTEHPSIKVPIKAAGGTLKAPPASVDDLSYALNWEKVAPCIDDSTCLLTVMHVNNETGVINDIASIGAGLKENYPLVHFHVDAVQSVLKLPLDFDTLPWDSLSFSGHKFYAGRGCGVLAVKNSATLTPLLEGGGQEYEMRGGTENTAAIAGLHQAVILQKDAVKENNLRVKQLKNHLIKQLQKKNLPHTLFNSANEKTEIKDESPYILNFSIPNIKSEVMIRILSDNDIHLTNASACSSKNKRKDQVLEAFAKSRSYRDGALRVSFSTSNTTAEIDTFVTALDNNMKYFI